MSKFARLVVVMILSSAGAPAQEDRLEPLPQGSGLAARFVRDARIESHPDVLFHDDFEEASGADDLAKGWDGGVHHTRYIRIATEPGNVFSGRRALEFTVPRQDREMANAVAKVLAEERDVLFLRFYSKFDPTFDAVGSSHNGAAISAHYYENGRATPGVPADGKNKFLCAFECWRGDEATEPPGHLNIYCYHPGQASRFGDHFFPSGKVLPNSSARSGEKTFGPRFVAREDIVPERDRWYCYEFMVRANTVGRSDGRVACWLDGKLIADFPGLRFRDVPELRIDRFSIGLHVGKPERESKKWYDDVVAATSYIGPMRTRR